MKKIPVACLSSALPIVALALAELAGCGYTTTVSSSTPAALSADNLNLIFIVSEDLAYHASGDINPSTANLTDQGLQRSLEMGTFLEQRVLGGKNVSAIYALEPMTHLETANHYPDLVPLVTIEQFAMLNQIGLSDGKNPPTVANSYPILASYSPESLPAGVAPPVFACSACVGLDSKDTGSDNETLVSGIVQGDVPGFYVFSAPWDTVSSLMANINRLEGYNLPLPAVYAGPNYVYAISITPSGSATLVTYNSNLAPPSAYPELPAGKIVSAPCAATPLRIQVTGSSGAVIPPGINTNETVHFIRHAEAHPTPAWEDGNYVAAGQWRALALPNVLRGKIHPTQVISIDPANAIPPGVGRAASSYVRTTLTVEPYAIANGLRHNVASGVAVFAQNPPHLSTAASNYFFTGGQFSNQTLLVAWEHNHIPSTVNALLASYGSGQTAPNWPDDDYDTIWTVKLDEDRNLSVDNEMCEGINSAALPSTPPQF